MARKMSLPCLFAKELASLAARYSSKTPDPSPTADTDSRPSPSSHQSDAGDQNGPEGTPSPEPKPPTAGPSHSRPAADRTTTPTGPAPPPQPSGPICSFGPRLAYTYFAAPAPDAARLNATSSGTFWFTIDHLLLYLSFFQVRRPQSSATQSADVGHIATGHGPAELRLSVPVLLAPPRPDRGRGAQLAHEEQAYHPLQQR